MTVLAALLVTVGIVGAGGLRSAVVAGRVRARLGDDAPANTTPLTAVNDLPVTARLAAAAPATAVGDDDMQAAAFPGQPGGDAAIAPRGHATQPDARRRVPARRWVVGAVAGGTAVLAIGFGPAVVVATVAMAPVAALGLRQRQRSERHRRRRAQLPEALDRLAAALRSGSSLPTALSEAAAVTPAPLGGELIAVARATAAGQPLADAIDAWRARHDDVGTRLAATALTLATVVGGAPARAVDGVAATLHERIALADERRALATQARVSALVLSVAPVAFAALLVTIDAAAARFLLASPLGWTALVIGLTLDAAGVWWMTVLTRGDQT